jgi:hypothetical protein
METISNVALHKIQTFSYYKLKLSAGYLKLTKYIMHI